MKQIMAFVGEHCFMLFGLTSMAVFLQWGDAWLHTPTPLAASLFFVWLIAAILTSAFGVVRHADHLAERLGEPFGTLILTLSVTGMEVSMIAAVMLHGENNPTLARDSMFAVVMIVMTGLLGVALLVGAFRHFRQSFNREGATTYLSLIVPLSIIAMVLPNTTQTVEAASFSVFQSLWVATACILIYLLFLGVQTIRHREFFAQAGADEEEPPHKRVDNTPVWQPALLLLCCLVPVVLLAEELGKVLDFGVEQLNAPPAIVGVIIASLILAPEGLSGIRAALQNKMQRSLNLLLGSALATIALTIPAVLVIGMITGRQVVMGLDSTEAVLLFLVLALSILTFSQPRTNLLQGGIHLMLFFTWLVLIFEN